MFPGLSPEEGSMTVEIRFFPYSETEVLYCGVVLKRKHTIGPRPQVG